MDESTILKLQMLLNRHNYKAPKFPNEPESDDVVSSERLYFDVNYYFKEGFRLGLLIGLECAD